MLEDGRNRRKYRRDVYSVEKIFKGEVCEKSAYSMKGNQKIVALYFICFIELHCMIQNIKR